MGKKNNWFKKFVKVLGPGFITGAADDDPTAIAAYTQAGAQFGYAQLWTALFTIPLMTVFCGISAKIGMVTGKGLGRVMRDNYSKIFLYFAITLLFVGNVINIGADLGAMAASAQMLLGLPFIFWLVVILLFILITEIFISYKKYAKFLKYLALTLLAYAAVAFMVKQNWLLIAKSTFIPTIRLDQIFLLNLAAILGTNISPYLFFWQASEEVEEEVASGKIKEMGRGVPKITSKEISIMRADTTIGMFFSNFICFFIAIAAASTLGAHGITNIETPQQAALALRPFAGNLSYILFTIGIIGSGLLAVPVLAGSASYALSDAIGWKQGLYQKLKKAHGFYGVIIIATLLGILINLTPIKPIRMLVYAAALNAILAPPLMIFIMIIANNKKIMGSRTISLKSNILGILTIILMLAASIALLVSFL